MLLAFFNAFIFIILKLSWKSLFIMKKIIYLWFICLATQLYAQDRILTKSRDTLSTKITTLDKQKIVYYLVADKDKKVVELPLSDLHKIIWRNGLEYIVDKELEEQLKKTTPNETLVVETKSNQEKNTLSEQKFIYTDVSAAPEIGRRRIFGGHKVNGEIKRPYEVSKILGQYDLDAYNTYDSAREARKKALLYTRLGILIPIASALLQFQGPVVLFIELGSLGLTVCGIAKHFSANKLFRRAISGYNRKREAGTLRPKMILQNKHYEGN